jgi:hypothetical protein
VGIGVGVTVTVGLGGAIGVAEGAGAISVEVTLITGAGCELQALKTMRDREMERTRDFMPAIIAEAARHDKRCPLVDMRSSLC